MVGVVVLFLRKYKYCKYINLNTPRPNLLSEGVKCGLNMKIARMGHTKRISHSGY